MSTLRVRTGLHRLTAAMSVLVFALIGVVGASPASAAPGSGSMKVTSAYQIDIHKNETVDLTITMEMEGISPSIYCTQDMKDSLELQNQPNATTDLNTDGNQCIMSIKGAEISKMKNDDSMRIEHKGSKFIFSASDFSSMEETDATMSVTFPGKVTKADSKAKTNGNTVTWSDLSSLNSISAEGKDSPGPSWVWIIVGVLVVIAIGGGITAAIVLTNRKKKQLGAPAGVYRVTASRASQCPVSRCRVSRVSRVTPSLVSRCRASRVTASPVSSRTTPISSTEPAPPRISLSFIRRRTRTAFSPDSRMPGNKWFRGLAQWRTSGPCP